AVILLVSAFVAVAARDMRLALPALLVHYFFAGLLFVDVLDPRLAVVYVLAGLFVTAILLVTAWQVNWGRPAAGLTAEEAQRLGLPPTRALGRWRVSVRDLFRLALAAAVMAAALAIQSSGWLAAVVP